MMKAISKNHLLAALASAATFTITSCVPIGGDYGSSYPPRYAPSGGYDGYDDYEDAGYPYDAQPVYGATVFYGGPGYYYPGYSNYYTRYPYHYRHGVPYDSRGVACRHNDVVHHSTHVVHSNSKSNNKANHPSTIVHNSKPAPYRPPVVVRHSSTTQNRSVNPYAHHSPEVIREMKKREEEKKPNHSSSSKKSDDDDRKKRR